MKAKIAIEAFKYLKEKAETHSKMDNLKYKKLAIQKYLSSDIISKNEGQQLFKFRTRMALKISQMESLT